MATRITNKQTKSKKGILNSSENKNDGRLATFTNSPQVYKLAPLQSRHINANLPQIHTRPTFSCNAL